MPSTVYGRSGRPADVVLRRLTEADIEAADEILCSAFATTDSRVPEIARYLALPGVDVLLASMGERPVGMVGAIDYDRYSYIGMMAVHPAAQHRGVGSLLIGRLVARLDERQVPMVLLDASEAGAPLYRKLGFGECDRSVTLTGPARTDTTPLPSGVRVVQPDDVPALADFDSPRFGADRSHVLRRLISEFPGRALCLADASGRISGYVIAQHRRLAPWMASSPGDAAVLLEAALSLPFTAPPRVIVPEMNAEALTLLQQNGFQVVDPAHRHMRRGGAALPGRRIEIYGQASFALG